MDLFQIYLLTVVMTIPFMVLFNKLHDGVVTISDLTWVILCGLIPLFNLILTATLIGFTIRKTQMFSRATGLRDRLLGWWDVVSVKKVF